MVNIDFPVFTFHLLQPQIESTNHKSSKLHLQERKTFRDFGNSSRFSVSLHIFIRSLFVPFIVQKRTFTIFQVSRSVPNFFKSFIRFEYIHHTYNISIFSRILGPSLRRCLMCVFCGWYLFEWMCPIQKSLWDLSCYH